MPKVVLTYGTGDRGCDEDENGVTRLKQPKGLFVDEDGSVLIADSGNNRILQFPKGSQTGKEIAGSAKYIPKYDEYNIKQIGAAQLDSPYAVLRGPDGRLLVSDTHNSRLLGFPKDSTDVESILPTVGQQNNISSPEGIKYPRSFLIINEKLLLVDTWSHRVTEHSMSDLGAQGKVICGEANSFGTRTDQLAYPSGLAVLPGDAGATYFVADSANNRVQRFVAGEKCGSMILGKVTCEPGSQASEVDNPTSLSLHPKTGSLVVVDRNNHRVLLVHEPATALPADVKVEVLLGPDILKRPWGACFDSEGFLYVSDDAHHRVLKVDLTIA